MEALLIILSIVAVFWLLRRLFPILILWLLSRQQRKFAEQFGAQGEQGGGRASKSSRREGDVTVESKGVEKTVNNKVGEYIDFEEE